MASNNRINITISAKDEGSAAVKSFSNTLDDASNRAGGFSQSLGRIRDVALGVYLPQVGLKLLELGKNALESTGSFEQSRVAFETMLGSAAKAQDLLTQISEFAKNTPFDLPGVVDASKQLLAYGFAQDEVLPTMRKLGDVAAGVSVPIGQLTAVYGQVRVAGHLMGQDLLQFTQAGVPLLDYLAQTMHKTAAQIKADMAKGVGPTFNEVQTALEAMTASGSKFGGLMDKQSHTFQGIMSNIGDSFGQIGRAALGMDTAGNIVKGSFFDRIKDAAASAMPILQDFAGKVGPMVQDAMQTTIDIGKQVISTVTDIATRVGNYLGPKFSALGNTLTKDVVPPLKDLWQNVIKPLIPVIGTALVIAIGLATDGLNLTVTAIADVVKGFKDGNPIVMGLATAFGILGGVMAFNAIFDALTVGFSTLKLVTIPSVVASIDMVAASQVGMAAKIIASFAVTSAKAVAHAAVASAAWIASAAKSSLAFLIELPKIILQGSIVAAQATIHATDTALAWAINAVRVSFIWLTELPKLIVSMATTAGAAVIHAASVSVAWVASAATTSFAWVTTELPKIVFGFLVTSGAAVVHAGISSVAWIGSATSSGIAWVVTELPRIIAAFVAMSAGAVINAAIATTAWVASAVTSSASFAAMSALIATPLIMPAIVVTAAIAALASVVVAYQAIQNANTAMNKADEMTAYSDKAGQGLRTIADKKFAAGSIDKAEKSRLYQVSWLAMGTNFAAGGPTIVGEHGPELVNMPQGAQVQNAYETRAASSSRSYNGPLVGELHVHNDMDEQRFLAKLGWKLATA